MEKCRCRMRRTNVAERLYKEIKRGPRLTKLFRERAWLWRLVGAAASSDWH